MAHLVKRAESLKYLSTTLHDHLHIHFLTPQKKKGREIENQSLSPKVPMQLP
jgi:hypothetical protein